MCSCLEVLHTLSVTDLTPVQLVNHTLINSLLSRIKLGMKKTVLVWTCLAGVLEIRCQHEQQMMSKDLGSCPGIFKESLQTKSLSFLWINVLCSYLVNNNCVPFAKVLFTHSTRWHAAKLMSIGLSLAVTAEFVEHKEDHCITSIAGYWQGVLSRVTWSSMGGGVMPLIGSLPCQLQIVLSQHPVCLKCQLINVPLHT